MIKKWGRGVFGCRVGVERLLEGTGPLLTSLSDKACTNLKPADHEVLLYVSDGTASTAEVKKCRSLTEIK
jgi:hypothetical protein